MGVSAFAGTSQKHLSFLALTTFSDLRLMQTYHTRVYPLRPRCAQYDV